MMQSSATLPTIRFAPRLMRILACVALLLCIAPPRAAAQPDEQAIDLRPRWEPGQTSRYELWAQRVQRQSVMAGEQQREQEVRITTTGEATWTVRHVDAQGNADCEMTFDWMAMTADNGEGAPQVNDSRNASGDTPMIHDMLSALTGTPIRVRVAADGRIESVAGTDAVRNQLEVEQLAPADLDFIESANDLATIAGAPAAAEVGDTWRVQHEWTHQMGFLHEDMRWRVEGVEQIAGIPVATVVGEADLELEVDRSDMPEEAPPIDVTLREGEARSQVMFDLDRHEAVGRNSVQRLVTEVNIRMPQQTIQQRIEQTIQSQVLRIAEE
ncbi:MAG: DUF6263 family protein [Phycisphaeraceae bacterium]